MNEQLKNYLGESLDPSTSDSIRSTLCKALDAETSIDRFQLYGDGSIALYGESGSVVGYRHWSEIPYPNVQKTMLAMIERLISLPKAKTIRIEHPFTSYREPIENGQIRRQSYAARFMEKIIEAKLRQRNVDGAIADRDADGIADYAVRLADALNKRLQQQ